MEKFTQKYTIIALLENVEEGHEFSSDAWPLHVTIVDTFAVTWTSGELIARLTENQPAFKPAIAEAASDEYFGANKQIHVVILDMSKELSALQYDVLTLLKEGGLALSDPQYAETGFRAHSTVQVHARMYIGDLVKINNLALVGMFPDADPYKRKIRKIIRL